MLGNDALRFQHVLVDKGTPVLEVHGCHRCVCLLKSNFYVYKLKLKTNSCRSNANKFPILLSWFAGNKTKGSPVMFDEHLQGFHQKYVFFPIVPFNRLLCISIVTVSIQKYRKLIREQSHVVVRRWGLPGLCEVNLNPSTLPRRYWTVLQEFKILFHHWQVETTIMCV